MVRLTKLGGFALPGMMLLSTALVAGPGCTEPTSETSLNPEGPPRVLQVFVREPTENAADYDFCASYSPDCPQLAYGNHKDIPTDFDDRTVTNAIVDNSQRIRVVIDELLQGNNLEEMACADGSWSRVPDGADPDDVANCAGAPTDLERTCEIDLCLDATSGLPVGILDANLDKAPDQLRFIDGAVSLVCNDVDIPLDRTLSFYQPSGNQLIPAGPLGIDGLGPAVILVPLDGVRTGSDCTIGFADDVVDKEGNRVCAPADPDAASCSAGDTSGISFNTMRMQVESTAPADGNTNVNPDAATAQILVLFNTILAPDATGNITVTAGGVPVQNLDINVSVDDGAILTIVLTDGYTSLTDYEVTISGSEDRFGGSLPEDYTFSFSTRQSTVIDAGIDAAPMIDADPNAPDADPNAPDAAP